MHELLMPHAPSGPRVEGDEAVREKILPETIATPEIKRGGTRRAKKQGTLLIEREAGPDVHAADVSVGIRRPRFVAGLAGLRDGVEAPDEFSGANIVGADMPGRGGRRALADAHAHDQEITENYAGCSGLKRQSGDVPTKIVLKVNRAAIAKGWDSAPGRSIDCVEEMIVAIENALICAAAPVNQAAIHPGLG